MHQVRFKIKVKYKDWDNCWYNTEYSLFARDEFDAEKIAKELFYVDYGEYNDMVFDVSPVEIPKDELTSVNIKILEVFGVVREKFSSLSYSKFLKAFQDFDGTHLVIKENYASFWFRFMDLKLKAVWKDRESYISEDEVIIYLSNNRVYSARNRLCDIYKAH